MVESPIGPWSGRPPIVWLVLYKPHSFQPHTCYRPARADRLLIVCRGSVIFGYRFLKKVGLNIGNPFRFLTFFQPNLTSFETKKVKYKRVKLIEILDMTLLTQFSYIIGKNTL